MPSVVSELVRPIVTPADGTEVRTTVNMAVPPASVVTRPEVGFTAMPAAPTQHEGTEVWMVRLQPLAMLPARPVKSSRTKRLQVPLGSVPSKAPRTAAYGPGGAGAAKVYEAVPS